MDLRQVTRRSPFINGLPRLAAIATAAALVASCGTHGASTMSDSTKTVRPIRTSGTVNTEKGPVTIQVADAQRMGEALTAWLAAHPEASQIPMFTRESGVYTYPVDKAQADSFGDIRFGLWLLNSRAGQLVWISRRPDTYYQYVAPLARDGDRWTVTGIQFERIWPR
jgi:hypothetical protein